MEFALKLDYMWNRSSVGQTFCKNVVKNGKEQGGERNQSSASAADSSQSEPNQNLRSRDIKKTWSNSATQPAESRFMIILSAAALLGRQKKSFRVMTHV